MWATVHFGKDEDDFKCVKFGSTMNPNCLRNGAGAVLATSDSVIKKCMAFPSVWIGQIVTEGSIRNMASESLSNSRKKSLCMQ